MVAMVVRRLLFMWSINPRRVHWGKQCFVIMLAGLMMETP